MRDEGHKMWRRVSRWYQDVVVVRSIRFLGHITRSHLCDRLPHGVACRGEAIGHLRELRSMVLNRIMKVSLTSSTLCSR